MRCRWGEVCNCSTVLTNDDRIIVFTSRGVHFSVGFFRANGHTSVIFDI